jgi:hypothetical protein
LLRPVDLADKKLADPVSVLETSNRFESAERRVLRTLRPNVLLIDSPEAVESILEAIAAEPASPVRYWSSGAPLPPRHESSTIVIRDVVNVDLALQEAWVSWLDQEDGRYSTDSRDE